MKRILKISSFLIATFCILGTVQNEDLVTRALVLSFLAAVITVGVYGLVAGIVKLDDLGIHLLGKKGESRWARC